MPSYCCLYVNPSSNKTCLSRYFAHGTATDFMYDVVRVPLAFTFEVCISAGPLPILYYQIWCGVLTSCIDWQIYGDGTASSRDCFKMFNPTDLASYDVCYLITSQQLSLHSFQVYLRAIIYSFQLISW